MSFNYLNISAVTILYLYLQYNKIKMILNLLSNYLSVNSTKQFIYIYKYLM